MAAAPGSDVDGDVEMPLVGGQDRASVLLAVDQDVVGALPAYGAHEPFCVTVRRGVLGGVFTTSMPSAVNTASKDLENLASRSRIKNRNDAVRSPRSITTLRACWVVQPAVGWAVTPRICTRRVAISMTNST